MVTLLINYPPVFRQYGHNELLKKCIVNVIMILLRNNYDRSRVD